LQESGGACHENTGGALVVFLFSTFAILTNSVGDETDISHQAHLTAASGPLLACGACHVTPYAGVFLDGQDLDNTTVCNTCHSPGGAYDGVNDPVIGAKANWSTGIYEEVFDPSAGNMTILPTGKERWCVTCHDDVPSEVNGVSQQSITCLTCHDQAFTHTDGEPRTYTADAANYQAGYRLKSVDGEAPLDVPKSVHRPPKAEDFRLCFSCHDSGSFLNFDNTNTNFRSDVNDSCETLDPLLSSDRVNKHYFHLGYQPPTYDSDWDGVSPDSSPSCPACHNVHGPRLRDGASHAPAMIRTGELIGRESEGSLNLEYYISQCPDTITSPTNELFDATGDSTGGSMIYDPLQWVNPYTRGGVCRMCHGTVEPYWREAKDILSCGNCHMP
jgi:hypothetical protein